MTNLKLRSFNPAPRPSARPAPHLMLVSVDGKLEEAFLAKRLLAARLIEMYFSNQIATPYRVSIEVRVSRQVAEEEREGALQLLKTYGWEIQHPAAQDAEKHLCYWLMPNAQVRSELVADFD